MVVATAKYLRLQLMKYAGCGSAMSHMPVEVSRNQPSGCGTARGPMTTL